MRLQSSTFSSGTGRRDIIIVVEGTIFTEMQYIFIDSIVYCKYKVIRIIFLCLSPVKSEIVFKVLVSFSISLKGEGPKPFMRTKPFPIGAWSNFYGNPKEGNFSTGPEESKGSQFPACDRILVARRIFRAGFRSCRVPTIYGSSNSFFPS